LAQKIEEPLRRGYFSVRPWSSGTVCNDIVFSPPYPTDETVHVQLSLSHRSFGNLNAIHDATNGWVETISTEGFKACFNEVPSPGGHDGNMHIEWMAYQASTVRDGAEIGEEIVGVWDDTIMCKVINFEHGFSDVPGVLATVNHRSSDHDGVQHPVLLWIEEIASDSFRACLKTGMGTHDEHAHISYIAYPQGQVPFGVLGQSGQARFGLSSLTKCHTAPFQLDTPPVVKLTINHSYFDGTTKHAPAAVWMEQISTNGFRFCAVQLPGSGNALETVVVDYLAVQPDPFTPTNDLETERILMMQIMETMADESKLLSTLASVLKE
jgi:hypothetical protein